MNDEASIAGTVQSMGETSTAMSSSAPVSKVKLYEIDYVGNESFVASQKNVLLKRSEEPYALSFEAKLSARGLHHRSKEHFNRDLKENTAIIRSSLKEDKGAKKGNKPKPQLLAPYFQRALAFERTNQLERAMKDYENVLAIDPKNCSAYFNRSELHLAQGNNELALSDLNKAISLDPMNTSYRNNKARILRKQGDYMEAINQTMIHRAIETQPHFMRTEFEAGREPKVDSSGLKRKALPKDPILLVLSQPVEERKKKHLAAVVDFISSLKFFAAFQNDPEILDEIANNVTLHTYEKGDYIFEEGMIGEHFFMILDGEVSIVKCKKNPEGDILSTNVLVKLFRGFTFGETALESAGGVRSAGALASQPTHLLGLHVDIYKKIVGQYKRHIRAEVRLVLSSCPAFSELSPEALDTLSKDAIVKNFGSNKEIVKENDSSKYLHIVKTGLVKIIKRVKKPKVGSIKVFTPYSGKVQKKETPGLWVLEKSFTTPMDNATGPKKTGTSESNTTSSAAAAKLNKYATKKKDGPVEIGKDETEFTVGIVASGQIFGELAVLNPGEPSPTTAISTTPCEVFLLDGEAVLALGAKYSQKCMNALTDGITLHNPPAEKLAYFFRDKYVQERQMKDMLQLMSHNK